MLKGSEVSWKVWEAKKFDLCGWKPITDLIHQLLLSNVSFWDCFINFSAAAQLYSRNMLYPSEEIREDFKNISSPHHAEQCCVTIFQSTVFFPIAINIPPISNLIFNYTATRINIPKNESQVASHSEHECFLWSVHSLLLCCLCVYGCSYHWLWLFSRNDTINICHSPSITVLGFMNKYK